MMKKYELLKDLPFLEKGSIITTDNFQIIKPNISQENYRLIFSILDNIEWCKKIEDEDIHIGDLNPFIFEELIHERIENEFLNSEYCILLNNSTGEFSICSFKEKKKFLEFLKREGNESYEGGWSFHSAYHKKKKLKIKIEKIFKIEVEE